MVSSEGMYYEYLPIALVAGGLPEAVGCAGLKIIRSQQFQLCIS